MIETDVSLAAVVADFILSIENSNFNVGFRFLLLILLNIHLLYN